MSLESGQHFGPYEVSEAIGSGGMGEVYRATDTNLKRQVAMKVLPASFADDAERLARFQREAELLASLNHPNIAQIYGLEKGDGQTALVMELVEGPTLADRIAQGPIAVDESLSIARQIIDALDAAHAKGIVHRDLKPANVKLAPDGTVKVLDFGIAKALDLPAGMSGSGQAQLTSPAMTEAGLVLGTAAYMSPEQARGRPVDQRADIWAFGCVLYEMLTGQPTFAGEDRTSTLARVLERNVDLRALPAAIPEPARRTIALCLEKDPKRRWHHIGDVRLGLDGVLAGHGDAQVGSDATASSRWPVAAAAAVVAVIATAITMVLIGPQPADIPMSSRFTLRTPDDAPLARDAPLAVSPSGREIAFLTGLEGPGSMYLRRIDRFETEAIEGGDGASGLFFAPDGASIGFYRPNTSELMTLGLNGGSPSRLALTSTFLGASSADDGTLVFPMAWGGPLSIRRPGVSGASELTEVDIATAEGAHLWPDLLPDGRNVLFTIWRYDPSWGAAELAVADLASGEHRVVLEGGVGGRYVESGHIVFWRGDALWAVAFDLDNLQTTGDPVRVVPDVRMNMGSGSVHFDVSAGGTLAYVEGGEDVFAETMIIDREGQIVRRLDSGLPTGDPKFSPDGSLVALTLYRGGIFSVGVFDLVRENLASTWTTGDSLQPSWIDNERLSFKSNFEGDYREYAIRADGSGTVQPLFAQAYGFSFGNATWSPDGRTVVLSILDSGNVGIWRHEPGSGSDPIAIVDTAFEESDPELSPRGDLLAYQADDSGQPGVYVRQFPDVDSRRFTINTSGGRQPAWSADGETLYYATSEGIFQAAVTYGDSGTVDFGRPELAVAIEGINRFDVAPDGQSFAVERLPLGTASREVRVIVNWLDELKRAVPTRSD